MPDIRYRIEPHDGPHWKGASDLRMDVFVVEQGVPPALELDDLDRTATHLHAVDGRRVIGTLRMIDKGDAMKVGRVAVREDMRKNGIGAELMCRAADHAREAGFARIVLDSQVTVIPFYEKLGYALVPGDEFLDAGIPHRRMVLEL
ncbi:GNAT family N-acetyltransferase [bacterium]|nr:GNAT family N-acetyltransferase [bacterium]